MTPFVYTPAYARRFWSKVEKTEGGCWSWLGASLSDLAERFGVALPTVHHVITRRTWAHVA